MTCGLDAPEDGLKFPAVDVHNLQNVLIPEADGGLLHHAGMVEVVASERRGEKTEMPNHLRWGVYAVFKAPNEYARSCFAQYGLVTDKSGWYAALYRPYHLMGLELGLLCLGCCWALMTLGFIGGTMNLLWMGAATVFMTLEKLPDIGRHLTRPVGIALIAAAGVTTFEAIGFL